MIVKSECIVLKSINYSDHSKIIHLFSLKLGIISVICKGIKKTKGSNLDSGTVIDAVFYHRNTRDIQILTEFQAKEIPYRIYEQLDKLQCLYAIIELTLFGNEGYHNANFYLYFKKIIFLINDTEHNFQIIYIKYFLYLITLLGFELNLNSFLHRKNSLEKEWDDYQYFSFFSLQGGFAATNHLETMDAMPVSKEALQCLWKIHKTNLGEITSLWIAMDVCVEIQSIVITHLEIQLEKKFNNHSQKLFPEFFV